MKRVSSRNIGILLICIGLFCAIILALFQTGTFKLNQKYSAPIVDVKPELKIVYPLNNTLFPPEIAAPTFKWYINMAGVKNWLIEFSVSGEKIYSAYIFEPLWQPDSLVWQQIKKTARLDKVTFNITCQLEKESSTSPMSTSTNFQFSPDSVVAPLFFRKIDLPFKIANERLSSIEWCLGDISNYHRAKTLLTGMTVCGNCHSFSSDGKFMGIDFDYLNDKGGYATLNISENSRIDKNNFYSWNQLSSKNHSSSGFLSSLSPDGRYVVSTINDQIVSYFNDNEFRFYPVKGVLGIFDRMTGESYELPGASDTMFVQCNGTWSPDGETIIFAKTPVLDAVKLKDAKEIKALMEGKKDVRFDLWSIPFNQGKGGIAKPITGASANEKSNYFPRVSPDGKWIVFTQAHAFMLRQLDSKLVIIPFKGGVAHELESNMNTMNSWHTWSPNSKWIAFSTKGFSPYTKIALTHIDETGHASPPVWLENFMNDSKAANIPEFINIDSKRWKSIQPDFLKPLLISAINIKNVRNGIFKGHYELNGSKLKLISVTLEIVVKNGKLDEINIKESKGISEKSNEFLKRIIQFQSIDLFQMGVNTPEEMVLTKAVEDGLMKGTAN